MPLMQLLAVLALLMQNGVADEVEWVTYESRDALVAQHEQRYGDTGAITIRAYTICNPNRCQVHVPESQMEAAFALYDRFTTTTATIGGETYEERRAVKTVVHELMHVLDYQDDGEHNGSPIGRAPDDHSDAAHWFVYNVFEGDARLPLDGRLVR